MTDHVTSTPLRLVFVARRFWPVMGGRERALARLADSLVARGARVTILTARWQNAWPEEIDYRGYRIVRLNPAPVAERDTAAYLRAAGRWLRNRRRQIDAVYVSSLRHEASVAVQAVGRSVPVVLRSEISGPTGDIAWQAEVKCGGWIRRRCRRAAALVASTAAVREELIAAGYAPESIREIADGVETQAAKDLASRDAARDAISSVNIAFDMPPHAPLAIVVGRMERVEAVVPVLAAWRSIVARWPNARLWLVGEMPDQRALAREIERRNLVNRAIATGVFDHLDEVFTAADLFLLPWHDGAETQGLLEAMGAGLPIVAADGPAVREIITDGREGILVPPNDSESWTAAVVRLLDGPALAQRLGSEARTASIHRFSMEKTAEAHLMLFQSLVERGRMEGLPHGSP